MGISSYLAGLRARSGNDLLMIPSVGAVILNDEGKVLLQRSADDGKWYAPGGAIDPDEQPADAIVREIREETNLIVEPVRVLAVGTSPQFSYPNGHHVQYVGIIFLCRVTGGKLTVADDESLELRYFDPAALPELRADHRAWIEQALGGSPEARFLPAGSPPIR